MNPDLNPRGVRGAALLDFSGVLSPGAVHFGRPQSLVRALADSGLAQLGLDPGAFWDEIINPTWQEGSTTARGYRRLLADGVLRLAASRGENPSPEAVHDAAARFTAAYLGRSTIAPLWAPLLRRLIRRERVIIATDHYAEATAHILGQLAALGLDSAPAPGGPPGRILVANSADLGAHKDTAAFWKQLRGHRSAAAPAGALLVDDFGFHEQRGDGYASPEKIRARRKATVAAIENAWDTPVRVFPFLLRRDGDYPALVESAGAFLS